MCAAHHKKLSECSAMDYGAHTLDFMADLLNSQKLFPDRLSVEDDSMKEVKVQSKRCYRILLHAYYNHQEFFKRWEQDHALCSRLRTLFKAFGLVPSAALKKEPPIPDDYLCEPTKRELKLLKVSLA